jgi:hypothetical protein
MRTAAIVVTMVATTLAVTGCSDRTVGPASSATSASSVPTARDAGALPRCRAAWLDVFPIGSGGGLGHYYQTVTVRNLGDRACALTRLGVQYADASGRLIVSGGPASPIENLARHRRVRRFGLATDSAVYAEVSSENPGNFSPGGCNPRQAATESIRVNGRTFQEPSRLIVCTLRDGGLGIGLGLESGLLLVPTSAATRS